MLLVEMTAWQGVGGREWRTEPLQVASKDDTSAVSRGTTGVDGKGHTRVGKKAFEQAAVTVVRKDERPAEQKGGLKVAD